MSTRGGFPDNVTINVQELRFTSVEWAFYCEELRQVTHQSPFSPQMDGLRQICTHPAGLERWAQRLQLDRDLKFRQSVGVGAGGDDGRLLTLDEYRIKMIAWKTQDIQDTLKSIDKENYHAAIAVNTLVLISVVRPATQVVTVGLPMPTVHADRHFGYEAEEEPLCRAALGGETLPAHVDSDLPFRLQGEAGVGGARPFCFEKKQENAEANVRRMDFEAANAAVEHTVDYAK